MRPLFFPTIPVGAGVLTRPSCLPPGGRLPLSRGRFPLSGGNGRRPKGVGMGGNGRRPKGVGMLSRRDRGDRDRCPRRGRMRGQVPATPFVGRDDSARRPGLPRFRRRGGTLGRPPPNRRTPPQFPIYVSKRPTKGQISPYLSRSRAFPSQGGRWLAAGQTDEGDLRERSTSVTTLISHPDG